MFKKYPKLIKKGSLSSVFHLQDWYINSSMVYISARLVNRLGGLNAKDYVKVQLLAILLNEEVSSIKRSMNKFGGELTISARYGLVEVITGICTEKFIFFRFLITFTSQVLINTYSDKISTIVEVVLEKIATTTITEEKLSYAKYTFETGFQFQKGCGKVKVHDLMLMFSWTTEQQLEALKFILVQIN